MALQYDGARRRNPYPDMYQDNGAPTGYGQQNGQSPYLDREARNINSALVGDGYGERARTQPVGEGQRYEPETRRLIERTQPPDQWGRKPGHPHYGKDPRTVQLDQVGQAGQDVGNALRRPTGASPLADYQQRAESGGVGDSAMPSGPHIMPDGSFMQGNTYDAGTPLAPEEANFQYDLGTGAEPVATPTLGARSGAEMVTSWGDTSGLRGFNTNEWGQNSPEYDEASIKNNFGKIASRYDPTQPGATRTLMADPEFQALFPNASLVEHPKGDQIDFGDGNPVDVLINAVEGGSGEAWAFQTGGGGMAGSAAVGAGGVPASPSAVQGALGPTVGANESSLQALLDQILLGNSQGRDMYNAYQSVI